MALFSLIHILYNAVIQNHGLLCWLYIWTSNFPIRRWWKLSKQTFHDCVYLFRMLLPVKQVPSSYLENILIITHHTDQDISNTPVHLVLWPNHKQERIYLMMHFRLPLNRREKNEEGNLKLYKSVQDSISGLLGDSFTDSSNSHGWLWGWSLLCNHGVMWQSTDWTYRKLQQGG